MAKKVIYQQIGAYNDYEDIKLLMGMTTDEIVDYAKNKKGHFYAEYKLQCTLADKSKDMANGSFRLSKNMEYAIEDGSYKGCLDCSRCDAYFEIYKRIEVEEITEEEFLGRLNTLVGKTLENNIFVLHNYLRNLYDTDDIALSWGRKSEDEKYRQAFVDILGSYSGRISYLLTEDKQEIFVTSASIC